ncbi:MAG: hypothetical protein ACKVK8_03690, partial [Rhodospirillales bacterium]
RAFQNIQMALSINLTHKPIRIVLSIMNKGTDRTANITGRKNKLNFSLDRCFNTNERPPWITSARKKLEPLNQATQEAKSDYDDECRKLTRN